VSDSHVRDLFERALEGRLADAEARRLREHLDGCAGCAADFRFARSIRAAAAGRDAAGLSAAEMVRLEARVRAALAPVPLVRWRLVVPAAGLAAAVSVAALWMAGPPEDAGRRGMAAGMQRADPVPRGARAEESLRELAAGRLGLDPGGADRIVLADFGRPADIASVSSFGTAQLALKPGGAAGRRCLAAGPAGKPGEPLEIEVPVPAGRGNDAIAVSAWVRAEGGDFGIAAAGVLADGTSLDAAPARRVSSAGWEWAFFPFPGEAVRRGGGLVRVRLRFEGAGGVNVGRIEMWASPVRESR